MEIKNRSDVKAIEDAGKIFQELFRSENISLAYVTIKDRSKPHKHLKTEEVCYIIKGKGKIKIGDEIFDMKPDNIIPIPKNTYHNIESIEIPVELIVVNNPPSDSSDMIF